MIKHVNIKIYGLVQGVGFRYFIKNKADEIGLTGYVRNEPGGFVYIEAEGDQENLQEFLAWCRQGPRHSRVERVNYKMISKLNGYKEFSVEH